MSTFGITRPPRTIIFGEGQRHALARIVLGYGRKVLICTDERLAKDPIFLEIADKLRSAGVQSLVYPSTIAELPLSCVEECAVLARAFDPDVIVGIGGGSCLDMAKLVSVLCSHKVRLQDCYGELRIPGPTLPVIALPTTSGTGSEATPVAVLADTVKDTKVGISSPYLVPDVALCDPELTYTCPPGLTATAGADALTHAIESFTAIRRDAAADLPHRQVFVGKNILSDLYALAAVKLISANLRQVVTDGRDASGRANLMLGSLYAGLAFSTAGTAAAHAIQYPVGALTHTAHGIGVAALLPYVMEFNLSCCVPAYSEIAHAMGVKSSSDDEQSVARAAIDAVERLFGDIGIPRNLAELGLANDQTSWTAEAALNAQRLVNNNPRPLDATAMQKLVEAAWSGDRRALRS